MFSRDGYDCLMIHTVFLLLYLPDCVIRQVGNHMDRTCFILVNACVLWWHKPESRTVCSSTMDTVSCTHVNLPNHFESLGG
jgi:hypothetical protein